MMILKRILLTTIGLVVFCIASAQQAEHAKETIKEAALEIIQDQKYSALITLDASGHPQARMMEQFPPEDDLVIWFGTNKNSRKVKEIQNDSRATVFVADNTGNGYVTLTGKAILVDDTSEKEKRWMEHWERFYADRVSNYLLIKFIPEIVEVVSYRHGLNGDPVTWRAPNTAGYIGTNEKF
jgi:general stress protein 26